MDDLLIHDQSRAHLLALQNDPPHALLLVGPTGMGKLSVATAWGKLLASDVQVVAPDDKDTIAIDTVRGLYQRTRSKQATQQVIIIDHAEAMGTEAQNAFLKLLEEPRPGVTFILTAPHTDALLPTIVSRVQTVQLLPLSNVQLKKLAGDTPAQELAQLLFVAQGRPAMLARMRTDAKAFDAYRDYMQQAKQLMGASLYERLAMVGELSKDRSRLVIVLEAMAHMVKLQLAKKPEKRWLQLADGLQTCLANLAQNGNPRIQLLRLLVVY